MKDPDQILLPSSNLVLISAGKDKSGDRIPFTPFDDFPLDLSHGPAIEASVSGPLGVYLRSGSRSQISDRTEDGMVEFIQSPPLQSPMEYFAHIGACSPKLDAIRIICHRVLYGYESEVRPCRGEGTYPNNS